MTDREAFELALVNNLGAEALLSEKISPHEIFKRGWQAHAEHIAKQEPVNTVEVEKVESLLIKHGAELFKNRDTIVQSVNDGDILITQDGLLNLISEYTSPQPSVPDLDDLIPQGDIKLRGFYDANANHTDNSTVIAAMQAKLKVTTDALIKLRDCDWIISIPDRMDAVRDIAIEALNELSQEKGE
jgi:hypothetical protein